jgi:hypothetical protein
LVKSVDEINGRFGRDTVRFGVARSGRRRGTNFLRRLRRYITCLDDVRRIA